MQVAGTGADQTFFRFCFVGEIVHFRDHFDNCCLRPNRKETGLVNEVKTRAGEKLGMFSARTLPGLRPDTTCGNGLFVAR